MYVYGSDTSYCCAVDYFPSGRTTCLKEAVSGTLRTTAEPGVLDSVWTALGRCLRQHMITTAAATSVTNIPVTIANLSSHFCRKVSGTADSRDSTFVLLFATSPSGPVVFETGTSDCGAFWQRPLISEPSSSIRFSFSEHCVQSTFLRPRQRAHDLWHSAWIYSHAFQKTFIRLPRCTG